MIIRSLDGLSTFLRAPDGPDSGVPTDGGEISFDQGFALFNLDDDDGGEQEAPAAKDSEPATAGDSDGADEESDPDEGEDVGSQDETPDEEETEEQDDQSQDETPVVPPRSWSKEDKEAFAKLPRATQERLAERERGREADFLRRQNEAANLTKGLTAKEQAAEQARKQYEENAQRYATASAQHAKSVTDQLKSDFPEVTSWDAAKQLAASDPVRYGEWQAAYQAAQASINEASAARAEEARINGERHQEAVGRYNDYVAEQRQKFLEKAPEFADPKQASRLQAEVRDMLVNDYKITPEELKALWIDGAPISVHDHRFQMLIRDGLRFRKAQAAAAKKPSIKKPVTQALKPGAATSRRDVLGTRTKQIDDTLTRTGSRDAGLALIMERLGRK